MFFFRGGKIMVVEDLKKSQISFHLLPPLHIFWSLLLAVQEVATGSDLRTVWLSGHFQMFKVQTHKSSSMGVKVDNPFKTHVT
ncbi:hypothetical protein GDO81_017594 [Engystomops pustulosus]|uniref:Uncharacterized protein n=1 Tax=Engystomops pustulosus TaxID=76066 RepID=A0AAV7A0K9_ENGPU|nr:hypothetical protein GDO81_017594 [Engystomops pustulosus]